LTILSGPEGKSLVGFQCIMDSGQTQTTCPIKTRRYEGAIYLSSFCPWTPTLCGPL